MNTTIPILTEIVEDVVEISDTSNSSGKNVCSPPICVKRTPLFEVFAIFLDLSSEQCLSLILQIGPIPDLEEPV